MRFLRLAFKAVRLALMRVGAGWMFALLTFNFNRTAIADLGALAIIVATLIGLHHFLSPFQVIWGRVADRHPILGYRRTPYFLLSSLIASLVFLALPSIAAGLPTAADVRDGLSWPWVFSTVEAFVLIAIFGISMSMNGSSSNALITEVTTERERGGVVAFIWATIIISGIVSAAVARSIMPDYDLAKMQQLYNLTPLVVMVTAILGIVGMERRLKREDAAAVKSSQPEGADAADPLTTFRVASQLLRINTQVRLMFLFILMAIMAIFLQDAILEPFGAEIFGMNQEKTARFQQVWGAGALLSMLLIGVLSTILPISKKTIATVGGLGFAAGIGLIALSGAVHSSALIDPGLMLMGVGIGFFNVGALSMMMEMTIDGQAGFYMGLWGMAQGLGNGLANIFSGALHTGLIETGWLSPVVAYTAIFGFEALLMIMAIGVLRSVSVQEFKGLSRADVNRTLALDTAG